MRKLKEENKRARETEINNLKRLAGMEKIKRLIKFIIILLFALKLKKL